ncbi:HoxN/HupN/NixA family nickel/cobalt transporter [Rhodococcus sp. T2V]|uniref:HoxN/HupN/NixA family nickel/cobalt transporter n=1 Tax=Rhodococcus sp. T2V TaxID=3034164 RepID=UPI0023E2D93F|nr:HoxN/HupN/NixA family nickel/cobalt transporter [Rhodococcus sp. T2V]MDF3311836.1 HoxN/HupN/NixA family nickel/cobalt transporter [Rhodococcus sp. T2V]
MLMAYRWTRAERSAVLGMGALVLLLNLLGWASLLALAAPNDYKIGEAGVFGVGTGVTAFLLGARHAFDADHIAAIDNTTRKLVGEGKPTMSTGFWFSLGHSSVVFALSLLLAIGVKCLAGPVQDESSALQHTLGVVGTLVAGCFLLIIGLMNLSTLFGIAHIYRHTKAGTFDEEQFEHHLHNRGFLARIFKRVTQRVSKPWHLYPVGLLMGLGFDTATQVALLVLAGGTAAVSLPWYAVLVFPVLFTAGMTLFDTLDGVFMAQAYKWAFLRPLRKIYYNFTVTMLSVTVAFSIGVIVLLQLAADELRVPAIEWVGSLDLKYIGFAMVALFVVVWAASLAIFRHFKDRADMERPLAQISGNPIAPARDIPGSWMSSDEVRTDRGGEHLV